MILADDDKNAFDYTSHEMISVAKIHFLVCRMRARHRNPVAGEFNAHYSPCNGRQPGCIVMYTAEEEILDGCAVRRCLAPRQRASRNFHLERDPINISGVGRRPLASIYPDDPKIILDVGSFPRNHLEFLTDWGNFARRHTTTWQKSSEGVNKWAKSIRIL